MFGWTATSLFLIKFNTTIISAIANSSSLAQLYLLTSFSQFLPSWLTHLLELSEQSLCEPAQEQAPR
jgi:hypothetical protein